MRAPEGVVALLFTDIEGSTRLARELGGEWPRVLAEHHAILSEAIESQAGFIDGTEGDAFFATFANPAAAARAAVAAQRALHVHRWPPAVGHLKVRMGLHVGLVERTDSGYVGLEIHRAARVAAAAHGGQILLTSAAQALLAESLESEPVGTHRLKDFPSPEPLFCAMIDGRGAAAFPPPRSEEVRPTNLPAGTPVLVGREHDVERIREALLDERERVVTLTGRGGVGKTSVALAVAAQLLDEYPGGTWLVRLATLSSPAEVLPAIATAVGAVSDVESSDAEAIVNRLRGRGPVLLVLDNLEHLLGVTGQVAELVERLPELQVLATSQAPLRASAEALVALDALDDDAALAVVDRVARRRGVQTNAEHERAALLDIVHLLDGLPLALELAAARLTLLTPTQLRERLRASSDLLRDDRVDRSERQRSLSATVEWTLGLLDERARALFVRMGAFAGPVELEDLEAVAGEDGLDVIEELAKLLDVALVRRVEPGDGRVRFGLPEALRQIAARELDARPDGARWRKAHATHAHAVLWPARHLFVTRQVYAAAVAAEAEVEAAIRWAQATGDPLAIPLSVVQSALGADLGHLREALSRLDPLLDRPPEDPDLLAPALWIRSWVLSASGRETEALSSAQAAIDVVREPENRMLSLTMRGIAHAFAGDHDASYGDACEATRVSHELGPCFLSPALFFEAQALMYSGRFEPALERLREGERIGLAADAAFVWRRHTLYGDLAALSGRPREALEHYAASLEEARARSHELQAFYDVMGVALALAALGQDEAAVEVAASARAQIRELAGEPASARHLMALDEITTARERLGPERAAECDALGGAVAPAERVQRAIDLARAAAAIATAAPGR